jgi:polysaccharide pyruvyl transferase WcaK-like protein
MKRESYIIKEKLNVFQTYDLISRMHVMLGMRLHALVFSAVASVPMLGLVYDPKIKGFLDCINQPSAGDVRELEYDKVEKLVEEVWEKRDEISRQLDSDIPALKEKARENAKVAVELISSADKN